MTEGPVNIAVFGSTGSIGRNTLDVIARHPDRYRVIALRALGFGSDLSGSRISPVLIAQLGDEDVNIVNPSGKMKT